jgi:hypothetical protein
VTGPKACPKLEPLEPVTAITACQLNPYMNIQRPDIRELLSQRILIIDGSMGR